MLLIWYVFDLGSLINNFTIPGIYLLCFVFLNFKFSGVPFISDRHK